MKCTIDNLSKVIQQELAAYSQDIADGIKDDCKQVARECKAEIKKNSPKLTKDYSKDWKHRVEHESREDIRITVYNGEEYNFVDAAVF